MTSHELARLLLSLPDEEVVHPGVVGDVTISTAYRCPHFGVIVVADREDSEPRGSSSGRHLVGPELPAHPDDDGGSLADARRYVLDRKAEGVRCPACGQLAKEYRRKLNSSMARGLIWLASTHRAGEWVDVRAEAPPWLLKTGGTFAKLKLWGLIEERVNADTGKTHSGIWKTTERGEAFARGSAKVPGYVVVYDGRVLRLEGEPVDVVEALGRHFDYLELWERRGAA